MLAQFHVLAPKTPQPVSNPVVINIAEGKDIERPLKPLIKFISI